MGNLRAFRISLALLMLAGVACSQGNLFDYYVLSLSWAPDFCAEAGHSRNSRECAPGRQVGFVVHGLWPQYNQGRGPENCTTASPVSRSTVNMMLNYFPTPGLIQHEWAIHGTCSGLPADAWFALVRKARDSVTIPSAFTSLTEEKVETPAQVETQFAAANPNFPKTAFRATCTGGALQEVRICFDKNLNARACTASAGECTASSMRILPVR